MTPLSLLLACSDPGAKALALCQQSPGLYEDADGQAALAAWLPSESWSEVAPTLGHQRAGGRSALRGAVCAVESVEGQTVTLSRTQPQVKADGSLHGEQTVTLRWTVDETVDIGLGDALDLRAQADAALAEGNLPVFAGMWESLSASFPDPLLAVDHAEAQLILERALYRRHLVPLPEKVEAGALVGRLENRGDRDVSMSTISADFAGLEQTLDVGPVGAGQSTPFSMPLPPDADAYRLTVTACSF